MKYILNNFKVVIGLLISLCALVLCFITIDLKEVVEVILAANYLYIIPAIALYFVWIYIRTLRLKYMFNHICKISIKNIYIAESIGYMANNLLPMRTGEIVRCAYICKKETSINFPTSVAVLLIERIYELIVLLVLGLISIGILIYCNLFVNLNEIYNKFFISLVLLALIVCIVFLTIVILLIKSNRFIDIVFKISSFIFQKYTDLINDIINSFIFGLKTLDSFKKFAYLFIISMIIWLLESLMYIIIAYSFNIDIYFTSFYIFFIVIIAVMVVSNLFGAIPSSMGGIGVFEVAAQQTLIACGVDGTIAISYSLVLHILIFILPINILGLFFLWMDNLSLLTLKKLSKANN